ncbi:universal stress protein [Streptacidiphilus jiangxiensis]|uniref:Nucleotide-binding universal stress protein, UspA family n=1 Tax=Streptacidiphilus jiangxiensis TaxID=235985 RepID=A0A1H7QUS1_STRJI|nr:universal stress protein [Streptacidiphilus jiangxiensis]SEL51629.1 Nucleotide-binding universal stress protein, UspA family [Streptacidiphilus jiangxiensis]
MPKPIVLAVDEDATDDGPSLAWAASEAALRGAELRLLHACGDAAPDYARQFLDTLADGLRKRSPELLAVNVEAVPGDVRDALAAATASAELLVLGARGSGGFPGLLVGSTSLHLAGTAGCPVVVVPDRRGIGAGSVDGRVVVGVDAKDPDEAVLDFAFEAAERRSRSLRAVHAWRYPLLTQGRAMPPVYEKGHIEADEERLLAEVLAGWRQRYPSVDVGEASVRSGAAKELVALSADAALVVVGRHGSHAGPLSRLGSVSLAVVQNALCPVAVVPVG